MSNLGRLKPYHTAIGGPTGNTQVYFSPESELWCGPATPHSDDQEFTDGAMPSGWALWDDTAGSDISYTSGVDPYNKTGNKLDFSSRFSWVLAQPAENSPYLALHHSVSLATNVNIYARMRAGLHQSPTVDLNAVGLFVCTSMTDLFEDSVISWLQKPASSTVISPVAQHYSSGSLADSASAGNIGERGQAFEYVAIHKVGTTYHCWVGTHAGNWYEMLEVTDVSTMAQFGMIMRNGSSIYSLPAVGCDFIRFVETPYFLL